MLGIGCDGRCAVDGLSHRHDIQAMHRVVLSTVMGGSVSCRVAASLVLLVAVGCAQSQDAPAPTESSTPPPPAVASQINPEWMTIATDWQEVERRITADYQQFGLRPPDESELPRGCNGCGADPATAYVTAYAPGEFDPLAAQTGEPARVGDADGYFDAADETHDATLTWQYDVDAWAVVRGSTTLTGDRDRLLEVAQSIGPDERAPIRLPLTLGDVPDSMPLATIAVDQGQFGATVWFAACGLADDGAVPACMTDSDSLRIQIWPADSYDGHIDVTAATPISIGGRDGLVASNSAAVQVAEGMLVTFDLDSTTQLSDILSTVEFASDPGDESTWSAVADWTE